MKIRIETPVYNERRYGRPWIARVDFSSSLRGEFLFGEWLGRHGYTGELYVEAEPGDIVARGQKDLRNARNSAPSYYIVQDDGNLEHIGENPVDARRFYLEKKG
jgi:hypothetical protein